MEFSRREYWSGLPLDSTLKSRDITLLTKVRLVEAMVFPVVMYICFFSFLSHAPPSVGSPYPLPTVGPPAPSARLGRRQACHIAPARKAPPSPSLPTGLQQGKPPGDAWGWVFVVQRCEPPGHPLSLTCSGLEGHLLPVTLGESASFWLSAPPAPLKHKKVGSLDEAHCGLDFQTAKGKNETESLLLRH